MYISIPLEFIIPTKSIDVLDIVENEKYNFEFQSNSRVDNNSFETINNKVMDSVAALIKDIDTLAANLTYNDLIKLHEVGYKEILMFHINNVPCFNKIKTQEINGMAFQAVLDMHIEKFNDVFKFHSDSFGCDEETNNTKNLTESQLEAKFPEVRTLVNSALQKIYMIVKDLPLPQIKEIHSNLFSYLRDFDIKYIPCFKKASQEMNLAEVSAMHDEKFNEVFMEHVKLLGCK